MCGHPTFTCLDKVVPTTRIPKRGFETTTFRDTSAVGYSNCPHLLDLLTDARPLMHRSSVHSNPRLYPAFLLRQKQRRWACPAEQEGRRVRGREKTGKLRARVMKDWHANRSAQNGAAQSWGWRSSQRTPPPPRTGAYATPAHWPQTTVNAQAL